MVDLAVGLGAPGWPSRSCLKVKPPLVVLGLAGGFAAALWPNRSCLEIVCAPRIPPRQLAAGTRRPGGSDAWRLRSSEDLIC